MSKETIRQIKTNHIKPPIPVRDYDWEAFRDGWDLGDLIGYGRTKEEAIANLIELETS